MEEVTRPRITINEQELGSYIVHVDYVDGGGYLRSKSKTYAFSNKQDLMRWLLTEFDLAHIKHKDKLFPKVEPVEEKVDGPYKEPFTPLGIPNPFDPGPLVMFPGPKDEPKRYATAEEIAKLVGKNDVARAGTHADNALDTFL